jgi:two-component system chemotaxis response regulator CheB
VTLNSNPTTVLIVDDSALYRQSIHNVLRDIKEVKVVGVANNGVEALEKIEKLAPDLLTLDVQMPDMDGIEVLRQIKRRGLPSGAIMVSSLTAEGAQVTTDALLEGAFDFVLKPSSQDSSSNRRQLRDALAEKIAAYRGSSSTRGRFHRSLARRPVAAGDVVEAAPAPQAACRAVILVASTGGPEALKLVLPRIPAEFPVPVLVVQHMPAQYTSSLAARLDPMCELHVLEGRDAMEAIGGQIIIAPGARQMKVQCDGAKMLVRVTEDPPENGVRPAADFLIRSVCSVLGGNALVVIMTGMGKDGLRGCQQLKQAGGHVFAQHRDDCVVYGMPKAVIDANLADRILPLGKIAPAMVRHLHRSRR